MAVSLNNKRNTRIELVKDCNGLLCERILYHHDSRTCSINYITDQITIDLCGWDTLTTRGKINLFLQSAGFGWVRLYKRDGVTYLNDGRQVRSDQDIIVPFA